MIDKQASPEGAITGGVYQGQVTDILNRADPEIEIEVVMPEEEAALEVALDESPADDHDSNLLETVFTGDNEKLLEGLAEELLTQYDEDLRSRSKWEETYRKGLKLLGLQIEDRTEPWDGACGVVHPLLTEAVVRFQSEAITETFPAHGPVKTQVIGKQTPERMAAAERVKDDMNWRLTEEMPEYRVEHERLLWNLPIAGSAFKKVYKDASLGRQAAMFVPAEDVVVNYGASDIQTAERVTHVMRRSKNWLERMIAAGVYVGEIGDPVVEKDDTQEEKDQVVGVDGSNSDLIPMLEMLVDLTIEPDTEQEYGWPYVVTINKATGKIMAIRRNWERDDALKRKQQHFVHYTYITGFGFYGFGLLHLVGGHADAGTKLLRQLVDAGTLSNIPGGFKARGLRIKGEDTPIHPGEFRDVDLASGNIKDNIMPLPYKEPSATLFNLLNSIVEDGRKAANISDASFSDANQNAPVGTTLALIERQLKTLSAVQARIHAAMRIEFKLLKKLIKENDERSYPYEADPDKKTKDADYDIADIIPVSDPNATTMGVRIAQYQAAMQLADKNPQLYDQAFLHREMLQTLGIKNAAKIVPMPEDQKPRDPVAENMAILMAKPVKAFVQQDHQAHILVHQSFMNDPKIGMLLGQNPNAQMMFNAMQAHIAEHAAYMYRAQIQQAMGVELPDPNEEMDPQAEFALAGLLAQAASTVAAQNQNEQAAAQAQQRAQDPLVQMQQAELALKDREVKVKEGELQLKFMTAQNEGKIAAQGAPGKAALEQQGMAIKNQTEQQAGALKLQTEAAAAQADQRRAEEKHRQTLALNAQRAQGQEARANQMAQVQAAAAARRALQPPAPPAGKSGGDKK
jgi:uncharacterized cupredoxin-like copper-binding protein